MPTWLVTGTAGFIGSHFVSLARMADHARIISLDKLTYAGHRENLDRVAGDPLHIWVQGDIGNRELVRGLLAQYEPQAVINFAAESHVDRSITAPGEFLETNVMGTLALLDESLRYWRTLAPAKARAFRFLQISTDEVFGSLGPGDAPFTETHPFAPNSPYAASKASADHLVRAFYVTYGLPTLTTHSSNNYGPYQYPEKLVPLMILHASSGMPLPVYGDGLQIRDWLYVEDHCGALFAVLAGAQPGSTYNIGGNCERSNLSMVRAIAEGLDVLVPEGAPHARLIQHINDRAGHDRRYALDANKMRHDFGWEPRVTLRDGLERTLLWYSKNASWVRAVREGARRDSLVPGFGEREGAS